LIVAEGNSAEHKSKEHSHKTHVEELENIESNGSENVTYFRIIAKDINDVNEVQWRVEESTHKGDSYIHSHSPKLS
jgi:hypothetical protein